MHRFNCNNLMMNNLLSMPMSFYKSIFAFLLILIIGVIPVSVWSSPGSLDSSFGNGGTLVTEISAGREVGTSVALQPDGKIVVAGFSNGQDVHYKFAIVRYNIDGTLDNGFGEQGVVLTKIGLLNSQAYSVMIQPDGKIVAVGTTNSKETAKDIAIVRYNANGLLDTTFGVNGVTITSINKHANYANSATLQPDGKLVVAAHFYNGKDHDIAVLRYTTDGSLDTTFAQNGVVKTSIGLSDDEAYGVVVQHDGKIVVAGSSRNKDNYYNIAAIRYNKDGVLDTTFGVNGSVTTAVTKRVGQMADRDDHATDIALQPDGKIIIVGYSYKDFVIVRYNSNGQLDDTFHGDGIFTTSVSPAKDEARSVILQPDGKIVVVGKALGSLGEDKTLGSSSMDIAVIRCTSDGILDYSFGQDGYVITPIGTSYDVGHSAVMQPDGKLIVAGYSKSSNYNFAVLRYDLELWNKSLLPNISSAKMFKYSLLIVFLVAIIMFVVWLMLWLKVVPFRFWHKHTD